MATVSFTWEIQTDVDTDEVLELFEELGMEIESHLKDDEYVGKKTVTWNGITLLVDDIINGA